MTAGNPPAMQQRPLTSGKRNTLARLTRNEASLRKKAQQALKELKAEIVRAHQEGASTRAIAEVVGRSHSMVAKIIREKGK